MTTIDLKLAKELQSLCKEKNLTMPDGYNWWIKNKGNKDIYTFPVQYIHPAECLEIIAPAYTLDELLLILPRYCRYNTGRDISELTLKKRHDYHDDVWFCGYLVDKAYSDLEQSYWSFCLFDPNPANAACKLLIWLIKENYFKSHKDEL